MAPDDRDLPAPPQSSEIATTSATSSDDAFAPTIAPELPTPPATNPAGSRSSDLASGETLAAPSSRDSTRELAGPNAGTIALPVVAPGHYRTSNEIARGGMGRIVAAHDQRLGRPVALKELLRPGPEQIGRFQREALITARLQHPGIVPVYEAGRWPSGEPFFAMKLVSGRPLDRVIAETRTLAQRLELLPRIAAAADAIAYAHGQRIIHRDLKPANILVGEYGETVVIDWGLAKDLDANDSVDSQGPSVISSTAMSTGSGGPTLTVAGAVMGTPAYMAPEQARGEPLDQRADVFALGAMLYHLLAGAPPYNARTADEVIAAAARSNVIPLEQRERQAPTDLVAIVNRAMAPAPSDRYPDAKDLADELRRFLTGQLVNAHRYTSVQRIGRFVRRHRAAVTIATVSVLAFATLGTLAVGQIVEQRDRADRERNIAVARQQAAEQLIDEMLSNVKDRLQQIGRLDLLSSLGSEIRDYYGTLADIPGGMPDGDVDRMAVAVDLVGLVERDSGRLDAALATWTDARATLARGASPTPFRRRMLAHFDHEIGTVYQQRGKTAKAIESFTAAARGYEQLRSEIPNDRDVLLQSADTHDRLGDLLRNDGKIDQAFSEYSSAMHEREQAGGLASNRPSEERMALSISHLKLASIYQARGESSTALESYGAALRLRKALLEDQPDNVVVQEKVLEVQDQLAGLQHQIGDHPSSIATYRAAIPVLDALARRDPANTVWKRQRGNLMANLGFVLLDTGAYAEGLDQLTAAIEIQNELVAKDPSSQTWQSDLSRSYTRFGDGQFYAGELAGALGRYQAGLAIRLKLSRSDPNSAPYRRSVAWSHIKVAAVLEAKREIDRAIAAHEQAIALRATLAEESPAHSGFRNELACSELALGRLLATRDRKRSSELVAAGVSKARALVAGDPINAEWKETLTQGLLAQAALARGTDDAAAATLLDEALAIATATTARVPHNVFWPGYVADIQISRGELANAKGDRRGAAAAFAAARAVLEPLASTGKLPFARKGLFERARTAR
ncbi:MAG: protein kinase [Kofleriaceae bacterium]